MGSVMYGNGIGRYGAGGLPDVTYKSNGAPQPLAQSMGMFGAVAHLVPNVLDFYAFYGFNWVAASYFGTNGGYGNPNFNNAGCFNANAGGVGCAGNNQVLTEFTAGLNWDVLKGRYGTFRTGLQYGHITRTAYYGVGGKPFAAEDLFMFNFRYIPFE